MISFIVHTQHFWKQKIKFGAPVLINFFLWKYIYLSVPPINLISFVGVFAQSLCWHRLWSSFWDACFCLFIVAFSVIVSFLFGFHFWRKFYLQQWRCSRCDSRCWTEFKNDDCVVVFDIEDCPFLTGIVNSTLKDFSWFA